MKSKERVLRAINHKEIDRVPFGIFGTSPENEERIRKGINASSIEDMYRKLGIDVWHFFTPLKYVGEQQYYHGEKTDFWGITKAAYDDGDSSNQCPLRKASSVDEVESYKWPSIDDFVEGDLENLIEDHREFAIEAGLWAPIFHNLTWLCGFENTLVNLKIEPDFSKALISHVTDFWVAYARKLLEAGKGRIDIVQNCNDFGTQNGLLIGIDTFREFFKPALKRIYDVIKEYDAKVMQHSCGAIEPIIPDLIEIGVDIINPVQVSASGMNIVKLKEKYGDKVTFYGGIDTQHVLPEGPEEKVREETRKVLKLFGNKGGYILAPSQGIEPDISVKHVVAMFDEGKKYKI